MKELLEKMLTRRYEAILSGELYDYQIMKILKDIKLILDVKKEID